jgi:hypothetical protein
MAIYIQIRKTDEDQSGATYEFGPSEGIIGTVFVARATREVSLLHIDDPQKENFYLSRVRRALQRETGEFPDDTCYAA